MGLPYSVYSPTVTAGLPRTSVDLRSCALGTDDQLVVIYGSRATPASRWIEVHESSTPCQDGPEGVGPAATFSVRGAVAKVMGACAGGRATCASATPSGIERTGYTTVALPSADSALDSTFVEIYSQGLTAAQIETFIRGLRSVV